jgi:hypothetical protein
MRAVAVDLAARAIESGKGVNAHAGLIFLSSSCAVNAVQFGLARCFFLHYNDF